jgi:hypothetical protein
LMISRRSAAYSSIIRRASLRRDSFGGGSLLLGGGSLGGFMPRWSGRNRNAVIETSQRNLAKGAISKIKRTTRDLIRWKGASTGGIGRLGWAARKAPRGSPHRPCTTLVRTREAVHISSQRNPRDETGGRGANGGHRRRGQPRQSSGPNGIGSCVRHTTNRW